MSSSSASMASRLRLRRSKPTRSRSSCSRATRASSSSCARRDSSASPGGRSTSSAPPAPSGAAVLLSVRLAAAATAAAAMLARRTARACVMAAASRSRASAAGPGAGDAAAGAPQGAGGGGAGCCWLLRPPIILLITTSSSSHGSQGRLLLGPPRAPGHCRGAAWPLAGPHSASCWLGAGRGGRRRAMGLGRAAAAFPSSSSPQRGLREGGCGSDCGQGQGAREEGEGSGAPLHAKRGGCCALLRRSPAQATSRPRRCAQRPRARLPRTDASSVRSTDSTMRRLGAGRAAGGEVRVVSLPCRPQGGGGGRSRHRTHSPLRLAAGLRGRGRTAPTSQPRPLFPELPRGCAPAGASSSLSSSTESLGLRAGWAKAVPARLPACRGLPLRSTRSIMARCQCGLLGRLVIELHAKSWNLSGR